MSARGIVWTAVIALAMVLGGVSAASAQSGEDDPAQVAAGQTVYEMSCAGCHSEDGTGVAGLGRPLTGIADQGDRATHIESITNGKGNMPAFGERLEAGDIEAAASYVRLTFVAEAAEEAAAEEEAATEETASEELAKTGVETPALAIAGLTMLAAGGLLVRASRRD